MNYKLDEFQKKAIDFEGNLLINAGPGSGKTKILTLKVIKELNRLKYRTSKIAALTFTNRAAEEISKRINFEIEDNSKFWSGTIHSFCLNWIIKPYSCYLSELKNGYIIIDESEVRKLKNKIKQRYEIPYKKDFITRRSSKGHYLNNQEEFNEAAKAYHEYLREHKLVDYDLILFYSYMIIKKFPLVSYNLSRIFNYFFIDEYQDTQDLQYHIIGQIVSSSKGKCQYFIVGDVDQAIYKSLGGEVKSSEEIEEIMGGYPLRQLNLKYNYRSTQRIVDFYNNFCCSGNLMYSLSNINSEEGVIEFDKNINVNRLTDRISCIIKENIEQGVLPEDICILAPQWQMLTKTIRNLRMNLPNLNFNMPGLTLIPRNSDNIWFKIARLILTYRLPDNYLIRIKWANEILEELKSILKSNSELENFTPKKFIKIVSTINIKNKIITEYLEESFLLVMSQLNIDHLKNEALNFKWETFFESITKRMENQEFRGVPNDAISTKEMFNVDRGINANTFHGVKGEEFETVIAFGLLNGYIPNWDIIINAPKYKDKESKQLLYVVCSRAKKNLYLFSEKGRKTRKQYSYKPNPHLASINFKDI